MDSEKKMRFGDAWKIQLRGILKRKCDSVMLGKYSLGL